MVTKQTPFASEDTRWDAVRRRDREADGRFVFSVRTTGIYCRPSCASKPARRENVAFHTTCAEAERAGFRPCKRCRPDAESRAARDAALVVAACRRLDDAQDTCDLATLARAAGLSPSHFHRTFKHVTGVTPKAYADARRAGRIVGTLRGETTITDAVYAAGYNASSRFYSESNARLGMTPTTLRRGGLGAMIHYAVDTGTLGFVLVAATNKGVCAILLGDDREALVADLYRRFPQARLQAGDAAFARTVEAVVAFVDRPTQSLEVPLDILGTAFQQRVWQALRAIPPGKTISYSELAQTIGQPSASRAVAQACGANPVAVAVPCHRVVRADGAISGYRWGVERKRALLDRERAKP